MDTAAGFAAAGPIAAVDGLVAAARGLVGGSLTGLSEAELLRLVQLAEQARQMLDSVGHRLIAELETRGIAGRHSLRSTAEFLASSLRISSNEARRRVCHAAALGPRVSMDGQALAPLLPAAATAQAAGEINSEQVGVVMRTLQTLPASTPVQQVAQAEAFLVEQARAFGPRELNLIARRLIDHLDPDGRLTGTADRARRRFVSLAEGADGMYHLHGLLDSVVGARAAAVLHALAAPRGIDETGPDERTAGHRMHDGFGSLLGLALRAGELPSSGGVPATVLITMTAEQFQSGTGLAVTSFGQPLRVQDGFRVSGESSVAWVVHDTAGGVLNYGRTRRIASPGQTLALIARDGGCSFPSCTSPPEWAEKHHVIPWSRGGPTDLGNLALLCDYHHDRIDTQGWTVEMRAGIPYYTPPDWIDPQRSPLRKLRR